MGDLPLEWMLMLPDATCHNTMRCFGLTAAALYIATGNESFRDCAMWTRSFGSADALPPRGGPARRQQRCRSPRPRQTSSSGRTAAGYLTRRNGGSQVRSVREGTKERASHADDFIRPHHFV